MKKKKKTIKTVNVVEIPNTNEMGFSAFYSFPDNKQGNKDAEECFRKIILATFPDREYTEEDISCFIEDGFSEDEYYLNIVHSINLEKK